MRELRAFPRRTKATPDDPYAFVGLPPKVLPPDHSSWVCISVLFTYDRPRAEEMARAWAARGIEPVLGGPAYDAKPGPFIPGRFVKHGYTITSRGCPNQCWFCSVPKREGSIQLLDIQPGHDLLDSNILATPRHHLEQVFAMLRAQPLPPRFTGGLEARLITPWIAQELRSLKPETLYCAYDTPDDLAPLQQAGSLLLAAGFTRASHKLRAYVLCGWKSDTFEKAERRFKEAYAAGFFPMAMLYRDAEGNVSQEWKQFQRKWARPAITATLLRSA